MKPPSPTPPNPDTKNMAVLRALVTEAYGGNPPMTNTARKAKRWLSRYRAIRACLPKPLTRDGIAAVVRYLDRVSP